MEDNPMQNLHSYWRMEYIKVPKPLDGSHNPFATIHKNNNDREVYILFRSKFSYIVLNKYPYNPGHILVVPFREVSDLEDLDEQETLDLMKMIVKSKQVLKKGINAQGFNVGFNLGSAAGAGIPSHLHAHIVPRWKGDTNFMPVIGNTKVLPQSLDSMWERLNQFID